MQGNLAEGCTVGILVYYQQAKPRKLLRDPHLSPCFLHSTACDCNFGGTEEVGCDKLTGSCLCQPGFTGSRCDQCRRGYCGDYNSCEACHPCFQMYDDDLHRFGLRQASLKNSTHLLHLGTVNSGFSTRFLEAEGEIRRTQAILETPFTTEQGLGQVANNIASIR